jgi:hypothetical protein
MQWRLALKTVGEQRSKFVRAEVDTGFVLRSAGGSVGRHICALAYRHEGLHLRAPEIRALRIRDAAGKSLGLILALADGYMLRGGNRIGCDCPQG